MILSDDVVAVVRVVPSGCVVSYGDIAELLGTSPRVIGHAMATLEVPDLPWWRVVRADGGMADHLIDSAVPHWLEEGIGFADGRVRIRRHRVDLAALADAAESFLGPLPGAGDRQ
jgi:methylated-DNA-protein-cysteine methyltransferase-like protein